MQGTRLSFDFDHLPEYGVDCVMEGSMLQEMQLDIRFARYLELTLVLDW